MTFSINHDNIISIEGIPRQWIPLIELFNPVLPQFPLKYIHLFHNEERIFGFPIAYEISEQTNGSLTWNFRFLSNVHLDDFKMNLVKTELSHRLGAGNMVTRNDIESCCPENDRSRPFLLKIWDSFITPTYGGSLPFGRFYDGMYSLARCASAFIPMSGGKSEWQMMYDFIRHYGKKVEIAPPWNFLEFFLLPTYEELLTRELGDFPKYKVLQTAIDKFGNRYFTARFTTSGLTLKTLGCRLNDMDGYDISTRSRSPNAMRDLTSSLVGSTVLTLGEKKELDFLIDAFNRMTTRAFGFIGLTFNATPQNNFGNWDGPRFKQFYVDVGEERTVGIYPKIWGMILQQGFGNPEVIPIDEWIQSFYEIPLQIDTKERFLRSFTKIGKLERMMWVTGQARKTNMYTIFNWLWCLKHGTGKTTVEINGSLSNERLRDANPLSCLKCPLKEQCLAYSAIMNSSVYVMDIPGPMIAEAQITPPIDCQFVMVTINHIPKYVFRKEGLRYKLIDGFTGLEIHESVTSFDNERTTVSDLVRDLSP